MNELTPKKVTRAALKFARKEFIFKTIVSIIMRAMLMIIPILFSFAVNSISKESFNHAYFMIGITIILYILYRLGDILNTYAWHLLYNKIYQYFTNVGLQNTNNNSMFSLSRISIGEYINIMNNDISVIGDFYCNLPVRLIRVIEFFVIFIYFFSINFFIGLAGIIVSTIVLIIFYVSSKRIETLNQKRTIALDRKSGVLHEILLCIKEIKGFNIFEPIKSRAIKSSDTYVNALLKQRVIEDTYKWAVVLLVEIFRALLFIYGIYLITQNKMELGVILVIYNYYAQLIDNFSDFATINASLRALKVSKDRFNKILEYSIDTENNHEKHPIVNGDITFKNVLYGYKDNPTLNNVNLEIKSGNLTCIVGDNNSGKKGIIDLLLKLNRQHHGEILIDKTNISEFNQDEYFNLIAWASVETTFFNLSIKENLSMIENDFENIVMICKSLGIHEYIIKLKNGYETILTTNGSNIDQNVKYLLGIARVLIKDTKIMIFDEIFNVLNKRDDELVMGILEKIKKDHTIIIFSKEVNVLEKSDSVIFMDKNQVLNINNHANLAKKNKIYKALVFK